MDSPKGWGARPPKHVSSFPEAWSVNSAWCRPSRCCISCRSCSSRFPSFSQGWRSCGVPFTSGAIGRVPNLASPRKRGRLSNLQRAGGGCAGLDSLRSHPAFALDAHRGGQPALGVAMGLYFLRSRLEWGGRGDVVDDGDEGHDAIERLELYVRQSLGEDTIG